MRSPAGVLLRNGKTSVRGLRFQNRMKRGVFVANLKFTELFYLTDNKKKMINRLFSNYSAGYNTTEAS